MTWWRPSCTAEAQTGTEDERFCPLGISVSFANVYMQLHIILEFTCLHNYTEKTLLTRTRNTGLNKDWI